MSARHYYLLVSLPPVVELGGVPPMGLPELRERVADSGGPAMIVETILLGDDLVQREAYLAGEAKTVEPAVLSPAAVRNEEPLPPYLATEHDVQARRAAADSTWEAYFVHAAAVATAQAGRFLAAWVSHEVGLRNALVVARAKALGLEPADYLVAPTLGSDEGFDAVIAEWAAAENPLAGLRVLDRHRWQWLAEHDAWFSFGDDELAAYAAKLMLLHRWHRIAQASSSPGGAEAGKDL